MMYVIVGVMVIAVIAMGGLYVSGAFSSNTSPEPTSDTNNMPTEVMEEDDTTEKSEDETIEKDADSMVSPTTDVIPSGSVTPITTTVKPTVRSFNISASNFQFSQEVISVNAGDTVSITLTATEGRHDLFVEGIEGASTNIVPVGESTTIEFIVPADAQGTYAFFCTVENHRAMGMEGLFVVN